MGRPEHPDGPEAPVTINTVTATEVSAGNEHPREYAEAKGNFMQGVEETRPSSDATARERKRAAEEYAAWFLDRTELLECPRERVNFYVDRRASKRLGVCKFDHNERSARIGITEDFLMCERIGASWADVCETVRHELLHAHLGFQGVPTCHTPRFTWLARAHNVNRLSRYETNREPRFVYGCRECQIHTYAKNRTKKIRRLLNGDELCARCGEMEIYARRLTEREQDHLCGPNLGGAPGIVEPVEPDDPPVEPGAAGSADSERERCESCNELVQVDVREYGGTEIEWCESCGSPL